MRRVLAIVSLLLLINFVAAAFVMAAIGRLLMLDHSLIFWAGQAANLVAIVISAVLWRYLKVTQEKFP